MDLQFLWEIHSMPGQSKTPMTGNLQSPGFPSLNEHIIICRTNIKQFSILYRGPKIWNSLPILLISSPSIFVFKKNLKDYLIDSRSVV